MQTVTYNKKEFTVHTMGRVGSTPYLKYDSIKLCDNGSVVCILSSTGGNKHNIMCEVSVHGSTTSVSTIYSL